MAPPRPEKSAAAERERVVTLCHLIMACDNFSVDNSRLGPILGIKIPGNVPRKINSIVSPFGFEFKGGKIHKKGGDGTVAAAAPTLAPSKTPGGAGSDEGEAQAADELSEAPLPTTGRKRLPSKPRAKATASKKRKLNKIKDEAEEADDEASGVPATEHQPAPLFA